MELISFTFFQCKTTFGINTCHLMSNVSLLLPLFYVDHLEIANCSNLSTVYYLLGDFGRELFIGPCHEDVVLTRKSHSCDRTAFVSGNSAGGSKLKKQALQHLVMSVVLICYLGLITLTCSNAKQQQHIQSMF